MLAAMLLSIVLGLTASRFGIREILAVIFLMTTMTVLYLCFSDQFM
jgi:hypothetical protein